MSGQRLSQMWKERGGHERDGESKFDRREETDEFSCPALNKQVRMD